MPPPEENLHKLANRLSHPWFLILQHRIQQKFCPSQRLQETFYLQRLDMGNLLLPLGAL